MKTKATPNKKIETQVAMVNPQFDSLVKGIIHSVEKNQIEDLRGTFNNALRLHSNPPDDAELVEYLWDFFYDWCVFEQHLPEKITKLNAEENDIWMRVKEGNLHGCFMVQKVTFETLDLKELFSRKSFHVQRNDRGDFSGISHNDIIEGRLVGPEKIKKKEVFRFARRPSYHPKEVQDYIKGKLKEFKKGKNFSTYQDWLWIMVGMYLKHKIYRHMPATKIYDDQSRI